MQGRVQVEGVCPKPNKFFKYAAGRIRFARGKNGMMACGRNYVAQRIYSRKSGGANHPL